MALEFLRATPCCNQQIGAKIVAMTNEDSRLESWEDDLHPLFFAFSARHLKMPRGRISGQNGWFCDGGNWVKNYPRIIINSVTVERRDKYVKFAFRHPADDDSPWIDKRSAPLNSLGKMVSMRMLMNALDRLRWNYWMRLRLSLIITTLLTMDGELHAIPFPSDVRDAPAMPPTRKRR